MYNIVNIRHTQNCIRLDRSHCLGNPFVMRYESERELVVNAYALWLVVTVMYGTESAAAVIAKHYGLLVVKSPSVSECRAAVRNLVRNPPTNMGCWCAPKLCHLTPLRNLLILLKGQYDDYLCETKTIR